MSRQLIYDRRAIASLIKALNPGLKKGRTRCLAIYLRPDGYVDAINDGATAAVHIHMGFTLQAPELGADIDADTNLGFLEPGTYMLEDMLAWTTPGGGHTPSPVRQDHGAHGVPQPTAVASALAPVTDSPDTWHLSDNSDGLGVDAAILTALSKIKWHYREGREPGMPVTTAPKTFTRWAMAWNAPTPGHTLPRLLLWSGDDFRAVVMPVRQTKE